MKKKYGPWALVTGASDGIGLAICRELANQGMNLILCARRGTLLRNLSKGLERFGVEVLVHPCDLSQPEDLEELVDLSSQFDVGLLVNAAGFGTSGSFLNTLLQDEEGMLEVNCKASLHLSHVFAQRLSLRGGGGIVLFSSIVAFQGVPRAAHYAATKAYIQTLGEAMADELKPKGVDVLVTAPGPVVSGFASRANMEIKAGASPESVAKGTLRALGKRVTVRPGLRTKFLELALKTTLSRWGKHRSSRE